jgi:hypothetical protein
MLHANIAFPVSGVAVEILEIVLVVVEELAIG